MLKRYVVKRLFIAIPSLVIATMIVFTLPRLIPGDVVQLMLEEKAYGKDLEELRAKLGLDRPLHVQYVDWLGAVSRGRLGESLWTRQPVVEELGRRLPVTFTLGLMAIVVAILIGVPIGLVAAVRQDSVLDFFARVSWMGAPVRPARKISVSYAFSSQLVSLTVNATRVPSISYATQTGICSQPLSPTRKATRSPGSMLSSLLGICTFTLPTAA